MELLTLDRNFQLVGTSQLPYINLQWNRKYFHCGDFSVQIVVDDYDENMRYIYSHSRPEVGMIQKVEYTTTLTGSFVQMSGFFLEGILDFKAVFPQYIGTGNIEVIARDMFTKYKEDLNVQLGDIQGLGDSIDINDSSELTSEYLGEHLYSILRTQELSYRLRYDFMSGNMYFEVWQGIDRTQEQNTNNPVTFAEGLGTMENPAVIYDDSNWRNYAVVIGTDANDTVVTVNIDRANGDIKRILLVDESGNKRDPNEQTLNQYRQSMALKGEEALWGHTKIINVEFDPIDESFFYLDDYDLGDKCDIVIQNLGMSYQSRIIEIYEVIKENMSIHTLVFGEKIPTLYEKVRT